MYCNTVNGFTIKCNVILKIISLDKSNNLRAIPFSNVMGEGDWKIICNMGVGINNIEFKMYRWWWRQKN